MSSVPAIEGRVFPQADQVDLPFGAAAVFVGEFFPGSRISVHELGASPCADMMRISLEHYPFWKKMSVHTPALESGLEPIKEAQLLADEGNLQSRFEEVAQSLQLTDDDECRKVVDITRQLQESRSEANGSEVDGDASGDPADGEPRRATAKRDADRLREAIRQLRAIPGLRPVAETCPAIDEDSPESEILTAQQVLYPILEIARGATGTTRAALIRSASECLIRRRVEVAGFAETMRREIAPYVEAHAGIAVFQENAGTIGTRIITINVPGLRAQLRRDPEALQKVITGLEVPFADIIFTTALTDQDLEPFCTALGTGLHAMVWAGYTSYVNLPHLRNTFPGPKAAHWAGLTYVVAGRGIYRGIELPLAPAVAGLRHRLDPVIDHDADAHGVLTPLFARKGPREIRGFDSIDTTPWSRQDAMSLSALKGLNIVIDNPLTKVHTLALDRSRSLFKRSRQATANRAGEMLTGFIRKWLAVEAPGTYNDPAVVREKLRRAERTFFPFLEGTPGFRASLSAKSNVDPKVAAILFAFTCIDPIETFDIYRATSL